MNLFKTIPFKREFFATICLLIWSEAAQASNWWNPEWSYRKQILMDTTSTGVAIADPIGTTPVLVRLHAGNFQFDAAREDGSDMRFVAEDNKTLLTYHIDKYDSLMGEAFVWVKVPDVKPGAKTSFWLYYGNGSANLERVSETKGTYDHDTLLVYHFNERGAPAVDATSFANTSLDAGIPTDGSFIGSGIRLDEKTALTIPASTSLQWSDGNPITISVWIKLTTLSAKEIIFSRREGNSSVVVGAESGTPYLEVTKEGKVQSSAAGSPISVGGWRHLVLVASASKTTLYLDGEDVATVNASFPAMNSTMQFGGESFNGELDELEISKVARPVGVIKLAALGQGEKGSKLLALGTDEKHQSWFSGGYVGVIVKSLTVDGWIVIGILMIMSVISWVVMTSKAAYLNNVVKGNARFMKAWHEISSNLGLLVHADLDHVRMLGGRIDEAGLRIVRKSSIYRIYGIGTEELRHRVARDEQSGASKAVSALSIQAIRASLDGELVRETQRLNSRMVLLTIAISGGPFLGLLGTVVGVMITFAAIAQQGEVNVNSIAPGISAALAATVAGLAVAIPALFGYNYLVSRVKDATSDMHVFIDEFVTKMAEFYGDENEKNSPNGFLDRVMKARATGEQPAPRSKLRYQPPPEPGERPKPQEAKD